MGNREDLLAGARRCLAEKGYARTTVRDIASEAGVSMAAIGYHFGSREKLLNEAMFESIEELGEEMGKAFSGDEVTPEEYEKGWERLLQTINSQRRLWVASIEAYVQAQHSDELREQMAEGMQQGRNGLAARLLQVDEETLDDESSRTLGSVSMALTSGITLQWLIDPQRAPSAAEIAAGLRRLADIVSPR